MTSDEARIADAVAALRARLTAWGIEEPDAKAAEYVHDMLRNGWRPRARPVELPPDSGPGLVSAPTGDYLAARQALRQPVPTIEEPA
jgi:hypothetical protein